MTATWHWRRGGYDSGIDDASYGYVESRSVDFDSGSLLTKTDKDNVFIFASGTDRKDWILDSGCTDPVNNNKYFSMHINLNEPVESVMIVSLQRLLKLVE